MGIGERDHPEVVPGAVDARLLSEFGRLELWVATAVVSGAARRKGRDRLDRLSDGLRPAETLRAQRRPTHQAERDFLRQLGVDPDTAALRADVAARDAVLHGRLLSTGYVHDVLTEVAVTHGITVIAADADQIEGGLELRVATGSEQSPRHRGRQGFASGTVVIADRCSPLAALFADTPPGLLPHRVRRVTLYAIATPDTPDWEAPAAVEQAASLLDGR